MAQTLQLADPAWANVKQEASEFAAITPAQQKVLDGGSTTGWAPSGGPPRET